MALEVRRISCPNCAASLDVLNARHAKVMVCSNCGSQLDLTSEEHRLISNVVQPPAPPRTPITLGMYGAFEDKRWQVLGRLRYSEADAFWDEWLMMTDDGQFLWLTEGESGFSLYDPITPDDPVDPATLHDTLQIDGKTVPIRTRGVGRIVFLEGELTWKAKQGDAVNYVDSQLGDTKYSIEWTDSEIEYFRGQKLTWNAVREAFDLPLPARAEPAATSRGGCSRTTILAAVIVLVLVCACFGLLVALDDSSEDGSAGGGVWIFGGSGGSSSSSGSRPSGGFGGGSRGGGSSGGSSSGGGGK